MIKYEPIINHVTYDGINLDVLRLDLIHRRFGGNKFFKLKYNIQKAKALGLKILTFGGAHSNHIFSCAAISKLYNLHLICVIRGEDSDIEKSPTLQFAQQCESRLHFISREKYKRKTEDEIISEVKDKFGDFYMIPEGGSNFEGVKGCTDIITPKLKEYDYVLCAAGTGATFAGIKITAAPEQKIIGVSVLKGENKLINDANRWIKEFGSKPVSESSSDLISASTILEGYHCGGYAKHNDSLLEFKKDFEEKTNIPLDYIYTAKLFYAVFDLIKKQKLIPGSKILVVHSGGLQGNAGYEARYGLF
jgi:1-aminocyclopropane-1-carboxylate deaminase